MRFLLLALLLGAAACADTVTTPCAPPSQTAKDTIVWRDSTGQVVRVDSISITIDFGGTPCRAI